MTSAAAVSDVFGPARRVLFVHAHPDDETISTGALIAEMVASGVECFVLTATRGERGEVRSGALPAGGDLVTVRQPEWLRACGRLGAGRYLHLGTWPARAAGRLARMYADSGMVWLDTAETLAGPAPDASADALTAADPDEIAVDIAACAQALAADALVTYDALGGYGHPDHVALLAPTRAAAATLDLPFFEIVSQPRGQASDDPDASWLDLAHRLPQVSEALAAYSSQLTVDGPDIVHVGGQREPIATRIGVRPVPPDAS